MIREFSVKLKPSNSKARIAFIACMSLSFAVILLSMILSVYRGIVSLVGVALLVSALTFYAKYLLPIYYYDITADYDGTPVFVVRQNIRDKASTLCRINIGDILDIEREDKAIRRAHKTDSGTLKYSYLPTFLPNVTYRLKVLNDYESAEIRIECSDEFAELLKGYAQSLR